MATTPWKTSNDLIEAVKRKIAVPVSQQTFTNSDILSFLNEEMFIAQVPSVLQYHEEYLVAAVAVPLISNVNRYSIPDRAVGMKFRDIMWQDLNGNLYEMARIDSADKAFFQRNVGANQAVNKFYLEGNDVVLTPDLIVAPQGNLVFYIYIRPNQLVDNARAATVQSFIQTIIVNNASINPGDVVDVSLAFPNQLGYPGAQGPFLTQFNQIATLTAVASGAGANQFNIGVDSAHTASNLAATITAGNYTGVTLVSVNSNVITISYTNYKLTFQPSNTAGFVIPSTTGIVFDQVPTSYTDPMTNVTTPLFQNGVLIDFLQTKPGHRIYNWDVQIPNNGISGTTIYFNTGDVPLSIIPGDYICLSNECIIPQIPPDLHTGLAERAAVRMLAAMGDMAGVQNSMQKIQEIGKSEGTLLDNRSEGNPRKIAARHSLLRYKQFGTRRRI